jgi:hypothetical protein
MDTFFVMVTLGWETTPVLRTSDITVRGMLSRIGNPVSRAADKASRDGGIP